MDENIKTVDDEQTIAATLDVSEDLVSESMCIEISEKRRNFGDFLLTKEKFKLRSEKKDSSYIEAFYKSIENRTAAGTAMKSNETDNEIAMNNSSDDPSSTRE